MNIIVDFKNKQWNDTVLFGGTGGVKDGLGLSGEYIDVSEASSEDGLTSNEIMFTRDNLVNKKSVFEQEKIFWENAPPFPDRRNSFGIVIASGRASRRRVFGRRLFRALNPLSASLTNEQIDRYWRDGALGSNSEFENNSRPINIITNYIKLLNDIIKITPTLSREPEEFIPPPPVRWTDCTTGMSMTTEPPTNWMSVPYTGAVGGFCLEPVFISIVSSSVSFVYDKYTQQYPQPITYTFRNTSTDKSYRVNLSTDETLFTINPTVINLVPSQTRMVTATLPPQNVGKFAPGVTNFRLQMNISKLS